METKDFTPWIAIGLVTQEDPSIRRVECQLTSKGSNLNEDEIVQALIEFLKALGDKIENPLSFQAALMGAMAGETETGEEE